jgi:hypothetical protein
LKEREREEGGEEEEERHSKRRVLIELDIITMI